MGLYLVLMNRYERESTGKSISKDKNVALAAGVVNRIFGEDAANDFQKSNANKIATRGRELANDEALCLVLSGAAYNMAYGRYLIAGGSRGMFSNDFLTYIRSCNDASLVDIRAKVRPKILRLNPKILAPLDTMQELGIYRRLDYNPNEKKYYEASHRFAVDAGVPFR
jgi:hypothetical protein